MAIVDLKKESEVLDMYEKLQQAQAYAKEWADTVVTLSTILANDPIYQQKATQQEIAYVTDSSTVNDTFVKAIPVAPDKIVIATPPDEEEPIDGGEGESPQP